MGCGRLASTSGLNLRQAAAGLFSLYPSLAEKNGGTITQFNTSKYVPYNIRTVLYSSTACTTAAAAV